MTENGNVNSESVLPVRKVRQWRVGTCSMGILLIAMGVALLAGRFNEAWSLSNIVKFWPVILIILGLEMVLLNILSSLWDSKFHFTYDVISVILVFLILIPSTAMVALENSGVLDFAQRALGGSQHYAKAEAVLYTTDETLESIAIRIEGSDDTVIRPYEGKDIKVSVLYRGVFFSQPEADKYAEGQYFGVERLGNTLIVDFYPPTQGKLPRNNVEQEVAIYIPQDLDVDLDQQGGNLKIILTDIKSDWVINHQTAYETLDISLAKVTDAKLSVKLAGSLEDNIDWDGIRNQDDQELPVEAAKVWGNGQHSLSIYKRGGHTVIRTR